MKATIKAVAAVLPLLAVVGAASPASASHRIEWGSSGKCITAEGTSAGSPVTLAKCGAANQEWVVTNDRVRLAGTQEYMHAGYLFRLGGNSTQCQDQSHGPYCPVAFRYLAKPRYLKATAEAKQNPGGSDKVAWCYPGQPYAALCLWVNTHRAWMTWRLVK